MDGEYLIRSGAGDEDGLEPLDWSPHTERHEPRERAIECAYLPNGVAITCSPDRPRYAARKAFGMIPEGYKFQSPLIRDSIEKGLVQGRAEGREEGREEGRTEGMARSVLAVLEARRIPVSPELRTRIMACSDLEQLTQWLRRAVAAVSADELITQ